MTNGKDYYSVLGVSRDVSKDDLKKTYRKLSMQYHPDRNPDNPEAEEKFKEISEAYSTLSDDTKRADYDNPMNSAFNNGMFNDFMRNFGGARGRNNFRPDPNRPITGQFIGVEVELPLKLYLLGGQFAIRITYDETCVDCTGKGFTKGVTCDSCNGEGFVQHIESRPGFQSISSVPCAKCGGRGLKDVEKCERCSGSGNLRVPDREFLFDIPVNTKIGQKFILNGVGRNGVNGGKQGDVGIVVVGIQNVDINKLSDEDKEQFKNLLEKI